MPTSASSSPKQKERRFSYETLDKKLSKEFVAFCKRSAAEENLQFLTLVKKYKKSNSATRAKLYFVIRDEHLGAVTSASPVNLDSECLEAIGRSAEKAISENGKFPKDLFDEAEEVIMALVYLDLIPKFQTRLRASLAV